METTCVTIVIGFFQKKFQIPYNTFGLVNICDPQKEIVVEERVLLFYKYDNIPGNLKHTHNLKILYHIFALLQHIIRQVLVKIGAKTVKF